MIAVLNEVPECEAVAEAAADTCNADGRNGKVARGGRDSFNVELAEDGLIHSGRAERVGFVHLHGVGVVGAGRVKGRADVRSTGVQMAFEVGAVEAILFEILIEADVVLIRVAVVGG
jgi:hypothetical protein